MGRSWRSEARLRFFSVLSDGMLEIPQEISLKIFNEAVQLNVKKVSAEKFPSADCPAGGE
jgi:hypothetical protein